jgi:hypothetical protein
LGGSCKSAGPAGPPPAPPGTAPQAAFGTCSEPARYGNGDKRWSTTVDVTHLQSYLEQPPGELRTRFHLDNVLSNVYNAPIWSQVTLEAFYSPEAPPPAGAGGEPEPAAKRAGWRRSHARRRAGAKARGGPPPPLPEDACERDDMRRMAAADVPHEVLPLVPAGGARAHGALSVLSGTGDRCKARGWGPAYEGRGMPRPGPGCWGGGLARRLGVTMLFLRRGRYQSKCKTRTLCSTLLHMPICQ